jgi:hypothetical protein
MSTTNVYFSHGTRNEQYLVEDLIIESLRIYGNEIMYIPRKLVSKDDILGEDRLSEFKAAFPIEMYFENVDNFAGQGAFIQKFGLMMEQSATLVVARRRWDQLIGRFGITTIPNRPCEGDLIYFPLSKGLFEIKFVTHQDPFYQLGKLYVYKLQVELFQYSSERIDTGIKQIDAFETLKTFSTNTTRNKTGGVISINITNSGSNYTNIPSVTISGGSGRGASAGAEIANGKVSKINIISAGTGYTTPPTISIDPAPGGVQAIAVAIIDINIDKPDSFGDNNSFKEQAADVLFNVSNPFGEIDYNEPDIIPPIVNIVSADSSTITSDSTTITADAG